MDSRLAEGDGGP